MASFPRLRHGSRSRSASEATERRFLLGTRAVSDVVAPAVVEVGRDHLRFEEHYARVVALDTYPRTVRLDWLKPLIEFSSPLELSIHLFPQDSADMVGALTNQMVRLESSRRMDDSAGQLSKPERDTALEDLEWLRDALQRGEQKVFSVSLYALVRAESPAALGSRTRALQNEVGRMQGRTHTAVFQQDSGLHSCLPEGRDQLMTVRNLDTSSVATMFPFTSRTLSMERGVLFGVAKQQRTPVIIDLFDPALQNANMVIFATSGAGKSYFAKLLALRSLLAGVEFIVIDPEDEYRTVCDAVGGQHIRLASSSGQHINPFDLPPASGPLEEGRDPLAEQVAVSVSFLEVLLSDPNHPLSAHERAVLDRALYQAYMALGITEDPATHGRPAPLLEDVYQTLARTPGDIAEGLAVRLERYVAGSLSGLFAGATNVTLDDPLVVFNLQALEDELRPVAIHLITGFIWKQVRRRPQQGRLLIIDEAWSLLRYPEGGAFLASMARRARKYYLGLVTITQDIQDFLGSEQGRTVLGNAATKLLMLQDRTTIEPVAAALHLSAAERDSLLNADLGDGLLFTCGTRLELHVERSEEEDKLVTSDPRKLAAREAARNEEGEER